MDKRWQAYGAQAAVGKQPEITLLVTSAEGKGKNFFGEPAIEQAELRLVTGMLEVVVDNGDVSNAVRERVLRNLNGELHPLTRVDDARQLGAFAAERKTKQIANLPALVAGQTDGTIGEEFEAEMAEARCGLEIFGDRSIARKQ